MRAAVGTAGGTERAGPGAGIQVLEARSWSSCAWRRAWGSQ
jgi:hypothetical protein